MKTQLVSPSARRISRDSAMYGGNISIIRFSVAIAMFAITILAILFAQDGNRSAGRAVLASSEFSSGMPLP
jgi:hypothetical protein